MTDTKHTPSPWFHHGSVKMVGDLDGPDGAHNLFCGGVGRADSPYSHNICGIQSSDHCGGGGVSRDEAEANARLIAVAPELLEALELARDYLDCSLGSPSWKGQNPYPPIYKAIAKAKGEE